MSRLPVSIAIIASNEEDNIRACLASVHEWASEVVVVVNDCKDRTVEVARGAGAVVFERPWIDYETQKNHALDACTQPWVLALDADEEVSAPLKAEIARFVTTASPGVWGAEIPRCTRLLGRWIRHGEWYPDRVLRLVRRGAARWGGDAYHTVIQPVARGGELARLKSDLLHHGYPDTRSYVARLNRQADYFARHHKGAGLVFAAWTAALRALWRFVRSYFLRLGFLDGFPGLFVATTAAYSCFIRYARLYEDLLPSRPASTKHVGDT
jgi:glycosyltransferase involved in cell wall biosynthesis